MWMNTRGPWTLALCLTPAVGITNGNFLQICLILTWPNSRNLNDLEFDLSRSYEISLDSPYAFLVMFNSNLRPNSAPLQDIRLRNLSDLEFDLSRSNVIVSLDSPYMVSY